MNNNTYMEKFKNLKLSEATTLDEAISAGLTISRE